MRQSSRRQVLTSSAFTGAFGAAPVLLVMYWRLSKHEEGEVEAKFGEQYRRYAREVPAFFPRIDRLIRRKLP